MSEPNGRAETSGANGKRKTGHTLLIVESPAKASTIERFLGPGYTVTASMGHLIDLPKSRVAIDVEHDFEPEYITVRGKAKILKELVGMANRAERVLLASDNDREGEAISYHLRNAFLKRNPNLRIERIVFNEITPNAIREAVSNPGSIDERKVSAQKARRVLDRLVGYSLSPVLWKKVKNGLSAGRVQSVALRLICDRENEVERFIPEEYWTLEVELKKGRSVFKAQLVSVDGEKPLLGNEREIRRIVTECEGRELEVREIRTSDRTIRPKPPYTTSKLQQDAANRLGFTSRKTMQVAQQLYEGVDIESSRLGLITYMRTDSSRVSASAIEEVRRYIASTWPDELPSEPVRYDAAKGAQDAHEAIRPTMVSCTPERMKRHLTPDQYRLYSLVWERFVSSQMTGTRTRTVSAELEAGPFGFRAVSTRVIEKGFQKALRLLSAKGMTKPLPPLAEGERFTPAVFLPEQHFTSGPARYTDASIVKALEELGIGRPSTYAPIISVLLDRYYAVRRNRQFVPTPLGRIINEILSGSFPEILDANFTAGMERRLDLVEEEKGEWVDLIREFYEPFRNRVNRVMETLESFKGLMDEETPFTCEKCGKPMVKKLGRFGFFLACSGFPDCMNTRSVPLAECPRPGCTGQIVMRRKQGGRGKEFYGCTNYPACDFITHYRPTAMRCPECGQVLVERIDRKRGPYKACINSECEYLHVQEERGILEDVPEEDE